jgi:hypothetical protein
MTSINSMVRLAIVFLSLFFSSTSIFGQWTDYGVWSSMSISKNISKTLEFTSEAQTRLDYDASRLGSAFTNFTLSREFSPYWKFSSALRLGASRTDEYALEPLRRITVSAKYKRPLISNLSASLRFLYQLKNDYRQTFRLSPALYYKVSKKLRLAIYSELFFKPSQEGFYQSDFRYRFMAKHKLSKRRWVSFGYQIEQQTNTPDPWTQHVFICSYDLELKRRNGKK